MKTRALTWWDWFVLWVEDDATQLGISLTTYFILCGLWGLWSGLAMGSLIVNQPIWVILQKALS